MDGPADNFHLINTSMTGCTIHTRIHVNGMIEVSMLGEHVHLDPFNRLACFERVTHKLKPRAFRLNHAVTAHTGFRWWDSGKCSSLNCAMAIATIHTHLTGVQLMAECHGLCWRVADIRPFRGEEVPDKENNTN